MKKRKIIFTVINDLTYDQRMIRICKSLVRENYEVLLVGRKLAYSQPLQSQPFQQQRLNCVFQKGKFFYLEYNLRLLFFLWKKKFDAVCAIDLDTILPAYYISRWKGKKLIYDAHEYFTEVPEVIERPMVKNIWEWVGKKTIPTCTYCYTVGNALADVLCQKYGTHFEVIRNMPVFYDFEKEKLLPQKPIILYQGALNVGRGLEEIIEAMAEVKEAELWLAGEGDLSDFLRAKTKELELEGKVKFLGYLLPEELRKITPQATIGINLLKNDSLNYYYSLANKTFDFVQAEVPAIHMNFPEYQKLIKEKEVGILIDDLKKETIVNAVNVLLQDADFYRKLKDNCVEARKNWTWGNEEKKLIYFYKKVFE
jgi:glycosyltransferase involved in cell wall biosynthesis